MLIYIDDQNLNFIYDLLSSCWAIIHWNFLFTWNIFRIAKNKLNNKGILEREIEKNIDLLDPKLKERVLPKVTKVEEDWEEHKEDNITAEKPIKNLVTERRQKKAAAAAGGKKKSMGLDVEWGKW